MACSGSAAVCDAGSATARAVAAHRALPAQALRDRLGGSDAASSPWALFLPRKVLAEGSALKRGLSTDRVSSQDSCALSTTPGCADLFEAGKVWRLSQDARGCRAIQQALEGVDGDEERESISEELRGHVGEAIQDPHANHVIQKCVVLLRPAACQFIIDELMVARLEDGVGAAGAARNRYACRVVQRLVEHCSEGQVWGLVEAILREASAIARHPYGNYVVQHLLEHGAASQRRRLEGLLEAEVCALGQDSHGSAVLAGAFLHAEESFCSRLAARLMLEPGLLVAMACTRLGHTVVLRLLAYLSGAELERARAMLWKSRRELEASRFGCVVAARLDESQSA